jgi:hypothetical protein
MSSRRREATRGAEIMHPALIGGGSILQLLSRSIALRRSAGNLLLQFGKRFLILKACLHGSQ